MALTISMRWSPAIVDVPTWLRLRAAVFKRRIEKLSLPELGKLFEADSTQTWMRCAIRDEVRIRGEHGVGTR